VALAGATALISGVSVFINGLVVKSFPDPSPSRGPQRDRRGDPADDPARSGGAAEIRALDRRRAVALMAIAVVAGACPSSCLQRSRGRHGPGAAFIHKTLFIWVAVLAVIFLRERLGWAQLVALGPCSRGRA